MALSFFSNFTSAFCFPSLIHCFTSSLCNLFFYTLSLLCLSLNDCVISIQLFPLLSLYTVSPLLYSFPPWFIIYILYSLAFLSFSPTFLLSFLNTSVLFFSLPTWFINGAIFLLLFQFNFFLFLPLFHLFFFSFFLYL